MSRVWIWGEPTPLPQDLSLASQTRDVCHCSPFNAYFAGIPLQNHILGFFCQDNPSEMNMGKKLLLLKGKQTQFIQSSDF